MSWNLSDGEPFAVSETSVHEVGCIHTAQGLEFDYVGVIIDMDLRYENGVVVTDYHQRAKTDQSLKGIKKLEKRMRTKHTEERTRLSRIHGLKDMIWEEYSHGRDPKVLRIQGRFNDGITELVLREY